MIVAAIPHEITCGWVLLVGIAVKWGAREWHGCPCSGCEVAVIGSVR